MAAVSMMAMAAASAAVSPISQVSFGRVQGVRSASVRGTAGVRIVCMAAPTGSSGPAIDSGDKVADKIEAAQEVCAGDDQSEACATAWDDVEAAKKEKVSDPLEEFCEDNPEADECRVYKD
ncbi:hypothetical protein M758_11G036400 [Ceratodon purpureus]|uniref:CP12 domain-containing protein n=1 Tax=Ceratodon purpureus TaxID=3225 RepID=A0A8T0GBY0_CERPU|nr:hypothetical protein KC19_11G037400 [Ceratodon purpureus]KAG0600464.1 hypothetical protein M758_11G036400 [Ceratodon purpureus]